MTPPAPDRRDHLSTALRLAAHGRIGQHDWRNKQGEKRSMLVLEVVEIDASVRFTTVTINAKGPA
ncbi:hypothetical protein C9F11_06145 [Streptomyces sp. YIM 121038]|uniref:hypothetical protein n=1 Tax=Streptomyces sp. YIM 121038 TaxID=2136401 RepID=UPI0011632F18|nr:hypothetical protein [Streptomyces sp. YIM 121038]QCX74929.1 hypothetical protein C9F11_06145 [Streptomyces sp. YIM 121038]